MRKRMKNKHGWFAFIAVLLAFFALSLGGCDTGGGNGGNGGGGGGGNGGNGGEGGGNPPPSEITVQGGTLAAKLAWLSANAHSNTIYTIEAGADEPIAPYRFYYAGKSNITVILKGTAPSVISLDGSGSLFTVEDGITLVLAENIHLQGVSDNTAPLVRVNSGGALEMREGAQISGNANPSGRGGGVYVYSDAVFTMNGGTIAGNTAVYYGGGVDASGSFTMTGGTIHGNTASDSNSWGGGVFVGRTFTMTGGTISGNSASFGGGVSVAANRTFRMAYGTVYGSDAVEDLRNTSTSAHGAALYVIGTAERGVLDGALWAKEDDLETSNVLVLVVYGALMRISAPVWFDGGAADLEAPHTLPPGIASAQGWQTSDNGIDGWTDFTPPSTADMSYNGKYVRYYETIGEKTYYSNAVAIRVLQIVSLDQLTIDMYAAPYNENGVEKNDGWGPYTALYILVNETMPTTMNLPYDTLPSGSMSVKQADGGNKVTQTVSVDSGDVVRVFWVKTQPGIPSNADDHCAFVVYYSAIPPNPAFNPASGTSDNDSVLSSKLFGSDYEFDYGFDDVRVSGGGQTAFYYELIDEFTVP